MAKKYDAAEENKTKEQLSLELAEIRAELAIKEQTCREQARELSRLKTNHTPHSYHRSKVHKEAEWFLKAFENHPDALIISRAKDGHIERVNPAFLKLFGYSRKEVVGKSSLDLGMIAETDRQVISNEVLKNGFIHEKEVDVRTKTGEVRRVSLSIAGITDVDEFRWLTNIKDITYRKRMEEALSSSEAEMRALFVAMTDVVFVSSSEGRFLKIVDTSPSLLYKPPEELLGKTLHDAFPKEQADFFLDHLKQALRTQLPVNFEYSLFVGGKELWFNATVSPMSDEKILMVARDITERKQAEKDLLKLNESLDQQVIERTALADARSKQLQALAVELIEAEEREKQRIAGLLHEDLQQLLAAARFKLESRRRSDPDLKQVQHLLEESISKARHMSRELSPAVLHHSSLAAAIERLCSNMREQFGLAVELEAETSMQVESAPSKVFIFRAIQELLFNIVKHADVDTAKVIIAESGDDLVIMVSDAGKGFDASALETYTGKTGLGLISLRERASYIGGSLMIESTPGKGSRSTLRVPVKTDGTVHQYAPETRVEDQIRQRAETVQSAVKSDLRVLFADDHKVMRQGLIRLVAGKPGILVVGEAANGREALEKVRLIKPDVVVMDISMPEMDGIEATRHIKAELPDVRVIGLSMHEDEHISHALQEAGAEVSLSKTTSSSKLLKAIYGTARDEQIIIPPSEKKPTQLKLPWD